MTDPNADFDVPAYNNYQRGAQAGQDFNLNNKDYRRGFMEAVLEQPYMALFEYMSHIDGDDERDIRIGMAIAMVGLESMLYGRKTPAEWLEMRKSML